MRKKFYNVPVIRYDLQGRRLCLMVEYEEWEDGIRRTN